MDSSLEGNQLGEKPLASVRKSKFQQARDLVVVICGKNPHVEMVENFLLVVSVGTTCEECVSVHW